MDRRLNSGEGGLPDIRVKFPITASFMRVMLVVGVDANDQNPFQAVAVL
jgi:hypothetical protein